MSIDNMFKSKFPISFEIFPPKTEKGKLNLFKELDILSKYNPEFISVTCGAGGSDGDNTFELAMEIRERYSIDPVIHFTCVSYSRNEVNQYLKKLKSANLLNILALRGDPPAGQGTFIPPADGFRYANELVAYINQSKNFNIAVAGYPEGHIEAPDFETDIKNLKRKVDAGANIIITQLFFDNNDFFHFMEAIKKIGITIPVIPGIMPITSKNQIEKITSLCGAKIPGKLSNKLNSCNSEEKICEAGIEYSIKQCNELLEYGVKGFHFYPLNKAYATQKILEELKI